MVDLHHSTLSRQCSAAEFNRFTLITAAIRETLTCVAAPADE